MVILERHWWFSTSLQKLVSRETTLARTLAAGVQYPAHLG